MSTVLLTDWNSGATIELDAKHVRRLRQLPATVMERGGQIFEYGRRTVVHTDNGTCCVVRETQAEIELLLGWGD